MQPSSLDMFFNKNVWTQQVILRFNSPALNSTQFSQWVNSFIYCFSTLDMKYKGSANIHVEILRGKCFKPPGYMSRSHSIICWAVCWHLYRCFFMPNISFPVTSFNFPLYHWFLTVWFSCPLHDYLKSLDYFGIFELLRTVGLWVLLNLDNFWQLFLWNFFIYT